MVPVEFIIKEGDEHFDSHSGLALIGALINRTGLRKEQIPLFCRGARNPGFPMAIF